MSRLGGRKVDGESGTGAGLCFDFDVASGLGNDSVDGGEPEAALPGLRRRYPGAGEDELLLRQAFPDNLVDEIVAAAAEGPDHAPGESPDLQLIREIASTSTLPHVSIEKGALKIELWK